MDKRTYYINGVGIISPQKTFDNSEFLPEITAYATNTLRCIAPDFKSFISPNQIRRLSRMLRIGLSAAIICVRDSGNINPDGVITATGYGLLNDTEKFLAEMLEQGEKHLTPTFFMQSTYNALSGLVGLSLKCNGYNNTYVSKGLAFEMAAHDAIMQLSENPSQTLLVGAYDEVDEVQYKVNTRVGHFKAEHINNLELFRHPTTGSLQGEGAAFFLLSGKPSDHTWCALADVKMVFMPQTPDILLQALDAFLNMNSLSTSDIDVLISGLSGDPVNDQFLAMLTEKYFSATEQLRFKHLCGEYCTASSFATWLGASILRKQEIPQPVRFNYYPGNRPIKTVIIVNQYMGRNYSFLLLKRMRR